jgi:predicted permease
MSTGYTQLLTQLFPALLLIVLGFVIRVRGPRGFVHGIVDWSKIDEPTRQRAGRMVGNVLLAMAVLIVGRAVYGYLHGETAAGAPLVNLIFVGCLTVLILTMIFLLLRLPTQDKNGKHGR